MPEEVIELLYSARCPYLVSTEYHTVEALYMQDSMEKETKADQDNAG